MNNPWLKKNPYLSLWLSGASSIAGAARGQAAQAAQRQATAATRAFTEAVFGAWMQGFSAPTPRRRKRR